MAKQLSAQVLIFMISLQQISPTIGTKSSTVASLPLPVVGIQNISPENQPASIPICPSAPPSRTKHLSTASQCKGMI